MPSLSEKRERIAGTRERNRAIVAAYLDGTRQAEISKNIGVSMARIHDIIRMYKLRALRGRIKP